MFIKLFYKILINLLKFILSRSTKISQCNFVNINLRKMNFKVVCIELVNSLVSFYICNFNVIIMLSHYQALNKVPKEVSNRWLKLKVQERTQNYIFKNTKIQSNNQKKGNHKKIFYRIQWYAVWLSINSYY